ncbi:MAG TPA: Uma2 family endonuclease [Gemmatimonadaceae bacterium]|nr:Uma2 family endonuclease [Gemmatimonadaceae bacterium]
MAAPLYHTAEMVRALIDETRHWPRYETVYGELLVTPAPRLWHQEVVARLLVALRAYVTRYPVGHVFTSPSDISWGSDTLVQPDVFVVPTEEARTLTWTKVRTLYLAIEVLAPSSMRADRFTKRHLYQDVGIPLYWVIDADERRVEVWTQVDLFPRAERECLVWRPNGTSEPFELPLEELFRPI